MGHGANQLSGRLEIFYEGEWGTVCAEQSRLNEFSLDAAAVACRQMGLGNVVDFYSKFERPDLRYTIHKCSLL